MNTELNNEITETTDLEAAVHDSLVEDVVNAIVADHSQHHHHHHKDDAATSAMIGKHHWIEHVVR